MKKIILFFVVIPFTFLLFPIIGKCQFVTMDEAGIIAKNWVQMKVDYYGSWGGSVSPQAGQIEEMHSEKNLIAYYCVVLPKGTIILSARKEIGPIIAYSTNDDFFLNKSVADDMNSLIASQMDTLISIFGPLDEMSTDVFDMTLNFNKIANWNDVFNYAGNFKTINQKNKTSDNYTPGDTLVDSSWDQGYPYNMSTPDYNCENYSCGFQDEHAPVGCVATAASQIMKYWSWPPYSHGVVPPIPINVYEWQNMPLRNNCNRPDYVHEALSELCCSVADLMVTIYLCIGSIATWTQADAIYPANFSYGSVDLMLRVGNANVWWDAIVEQIDQGQPIHYFISGHSIVCDGYEIWPNDIKLLHMNWGHDNGSTTFYYLDGLPGGWTLEGMIRDIVPNVALGSNLSGIYPFDNTFPYRYFNKNAVNYGSSGISAIFQPGQYLQFLPEVTAMSTGSSTYLEFQGNPGNITRLFTNGDTSRGIKISKGAIRQTFGGTVKLYKREGY